MRVRTAVVIGCLGLLTACGSATDSVTFKAPANFHQKASMGPLMQMWATPDDKSVMMLIAAPTKLDLDKAFVQANLKDADVKRKERIAICGKQDAYYVVADATTGANVSVGVGAGDSKKDPSAVEFLATNVNDKTYMAMYIRPLKAAADPAAESALRNVCAK